MLRIDKIFVRLADYPKTSLCKVRNTLETKLKDVASATNYRVEQNEMQIEVILEKPISLQTANKIINAFRKERMIIYDVHWKRATIGAFIRGYLEIVVA